MKRNYFAGGNTKRGFVSFYENITDKKKCEKFVILKGGSGVGKSTIMKKAADNFINDFDIEYYYCTSDLNSLDGVVIRGRDIAILDGTSPHIVEPSMVGCGNYIVDLSNYIETSCLVKQKEAISFYMDKKQFFFNSAYSFINSAGGLFDNSRNMFFEQIDFFALNKIVDKIQNEIEIIEGISKVKKLFSGGITYCGEVYLDNFVQDKLIYLDGDKRLASIVLERLYYSLLQKNIDLILFMSPLCDKTIYGIGTINAQITCHDKLKKNNERLIIDINEVLKINNDKMSYIKLATDMIDKLIATAGDCLKNAKDAHLEIEKIYANAVDFDGVTDLTAKLISWLNG